MIAGERWPSGFAVAPLERTSSGIELELLVLRPGFQRHHIVYVPCDVEREQSRTYWSRPAGRKRICESDHAASWSTAALP